MKKVIEVVGTAARKADKDNYSALKTNKEVCSTHMRKQTVGKCADLER
jgi:hypothetical protein